MTIKTIEIQGTEQNVRIERLEDAIGRTSAQVFVGNRLVCEVARDEDRDSRYAKARDAAAFIYGRDKRGNPAGTNSMIHEVLTEIERVAGC